MRPLDGRTREMISLSRGPVLRMLARVALLSLVFGLVVTWLMDNAVVGFGLAGVFLVVAWTETLIEAALMVRSMIRRDDDVDIVEKEETS